MSGKRDQFANIGRLLIIRDLDNNENFVAAEIIGVNKDGHATHVRIQTGEMSGEVRTLGHFKAYEYVSHTNSLGILATVWAE